MEKTCTKCNEIKDVSEFHRASKGKYGCGSVCKVCVAKKHQEIYEYQAEYWQKPENKARKKRNSRKSYLKHKKKILEHCRKNNLKSKYGISVEDYDKMLLAQGGRCKICGKMPRKKRLHIDHDHKANEVRGLLCCQCNLMLGSARDKPMILRLAALYLEEYIVE